MFIEHENKISRQGGTLALFVKSEALKLDLGAGDTISGVFCRPEDMEELRSRIHGNDPNLFFIVIWPDGTEVRKALSDRVLGSSLDKEPADILGPFSDLNEVRSFLKIMDKGEPRSSFERFIQ